MSAYSIHRSVMAAEVMAAAAGVPTHLRRGWMVDGTLGEAGHTRLFRRLFSVPVLASDRDPAMIARARRRLARGSGSSEVRIVQSPFGRLDAMLAELAEPVWFILLDLGVSMFHFRGAERGFSYMDASLDMRLSPDLERTAADLVNELPESDLADLIYRYGEERLSRRIAGRIVERRPIASAEELAGIVAGVAGGRSSDRSGPHPARRVFQALRIAVNGELDELERALERLPGFLAPGGRLAVISFHSLEDRMVKEAFRTLGDRKPRAANRPGAEWKRAQREARRDAQRDYFLLTPRPILPSEREVGRNPAARSAKLRILERKAPDT